MKQYSVTVNLVVRADSEDDAIEDALELITQGQFDIDAKEVA